MREIKLDDSISSSAERIKNCRMEKFSVTFGYKGKSCVESFPRNFIPRYRERQRVECRRECARSKVARRAASNLVPRQDILPQDVVSLMYLPWLLTPIELPLAPLMAPTALRSQPYYTLFPLLTRSLAFALYALVNCV
ncbi:hypothetical protein KQX54_008559 [Cotesia glomerata]|uniref:Uncharacterized protein n=1 Tax=Cotesia glomerata TaxID=32391 RepID=A0AAV7J8G5_COTGL|nr:hypothetical protein KQX54_008559 [Cotesia glomerata]